VLTFNFMQSLSLFYFGPCVCSASLFYRSCSVVCLSPTFLPRNARGGTISYLDTMTNNSSRSHPSFHPYVLRLYLKYTKIIQFIFYLTNIYSLDMFLIKFPNTLWISDAVVLAVQAMLLEARKSARMVK
jgi:hypothetical protein